MKKIISIAIFFIFSSIIQQNVMYGFDSLELQLNENGKFIENGVKLIYETENKDEFQRLVKKLTDVKGHEKIGIKDNLINYDENNTKYSITVWQEEKTKVSIQVINTDREKLTKDILNEIVQLSDDSSLSQKVYKYTKIETEKNYKDGIDFLDKDINIDREIEINNGKVINGTLRDDTEVNLAHMKYDTGNYVIVGTPMIFVTY
ncbi:MAG: hypothetical protein RR620_10830 [Clostridium sp.]